MDPIAFDALVKQFGAWGVLIGILLFGPRGMWAKPPSQSPELVAINALADDFTGLNTRMDTMDHRLREVSERVARIEGYLEAPRQRENRRARQ